MKGYDWENFKSHKGFSSKVPWRGFIIVYLSSSLQDVVHDDDDDGSDNDDDDDYTTKLPCQYQVQKEVALGFLRKDSFCLWVPDICETVFHPISIENIFECSF